MNVLALATGWIVIAFVGASAGVILWKIARNDIDLKHLISEPGGDASLSRFQFLIFTFVVAMSLFMVTLGQDVPAFPDSIPPGVFALLGISGGSYVISKGIQANRDMKEKELEARIDESARAASDRSQIFGSASPAAGFSAGASSQNTGGASSVTPPQGGAGSSLGSSPQA